METFIVIISVIFSLFLAVMIWKKFGTFLSDTDRATKSKFELFIKKIVAFIVTLVFGIAITYEILSYLFVDMI